MINSLGGIGSYRSLFNTQSSNSTSQTITTFDDVLQITGQSDTEENTSTSNSSNIGSSSSGTNSKMDLNNDGQVTIDEIMKYLEMQQSNKEFDQTASEEGAQQMSQEHNKISNLDNFKTQQASKAYLSSQMILSTATELFA